MSVEKRTSFEAYEYVNNQGLDWETDRTEVIRQCSYCGAWVDVDDWSGEWEHKDKTHYNICDDCKHNIKDGLPIEEFDSQDEELEDYLTEMEETEEEE